VRTLQEGGTCRRLTSDDAPLSNSAWYAYGGHVFAANLYARYAQLKSDKQQHSQRQLTPPPTTAATSKPAPSDYGVAADKRIKRIPDRQMDTHQVHYFSMRGDWLHPGV
jgi:hypothetical protein